MVHHNPIICCNLTYWAIYDNMLWCSKRNWPREYIKKENKIYKIMLMNGSLSSDSAKPFKFIN